MAGSARAVLGVDAAWTALQPSGVALVVEAEAGWRLVTTQPSYDDFVAAAHGEATAARAGGGIPNADRLLHACTRLHPKGVDLVTIDMPLSTEPITARRTSDNAINKAYGGRHCGTHSPSATRPGRISDDLTVGFTTAGYPLRVSMPVRRGLAEVYPHPALLELTGARMRLPYKAAKTLKYWPGMSGAERRIRLFEQWRLIVAALDREIAGAAIGIGEPAAADVGAALKAYENKLDAVICAWIGICILEGRAVAFGDAASAIWVPVAR